MDAGKRMTQESFLSRADQARLHTDGKRAAHRRALKRPVGMGMIRELHAYRTRSGASAVRSSTTTWPRRGSGAPKPGKSSSSNKTAIRKACASASSGPLSATQKGSKSVMCRPAVLSSPLSRLE